MFMSDYEDSELGLCILARHLSEWPWQKYTKILDQEALRQLVRVKTAHRTGRELCPQWTPLRIWYGRSSSCSCVWPWCHHTVRRPPWWAARWRSLADRRQTPSYTLEGGLLWREGEGLFESSGTEERTYRYICVCEPTKAGKNWMMQLCVVAFNVEVVQTTQEMIQPSLNAEACWCWVWIMLFDTLKTIYPVARTWCFHYIAAWDHVGRPEVQVWFPPVCFHWKRNMCMPQCIVNKRQSK